MATDTTTDTASPLVRPEGLREIADGIWVIPDGRVPLVPNVGVVAGRDTVLVVDTGMGPQSGARVLEAAQRIAAGRRLLLTLTHFHPEHGFGAQVFRDAASIVYNRAQRDDLAAKGAAYLAMFRGFGPAVAAALDGTELVMPHIAYDGPGCTIDLGGRVAELHTWGRAHTNGDQVVWLPDARVLFAGDLAEERIFPIFPWFPPDDTDINGARWAEVLARCAAMSPRIVVPGHGDVGGPDILIAVRQYMLDLDAQVAAARARGLKAEAIVAELEPRIRASYPDWQAPEWIGFAIRYYASLG